MDPNECLKKIYENVFFLEGDYDVALEHIEALLDWLIIDGFKPDPIETCLSWEDVVSGSYWFFADYHSGQTSDEYRIQCKASEIYHPGPMECGPEEDSAAEMFYEALESLKKN